MKQYSNSAVILMHKFWVICHYFNYPAYILLAQNCYYNLQQTDVPNTEINANTVHTRDEKQKAKKFFEGRPKQQVHVYNATN